MGMKEMIARVGDRLMQSGLESVCLTGEELVRCKDCKHWEQQTGHCPYNSIFTHSEWFCADGEKDDGQIKRPKETFWDSLSETDLMEPMHHFED